MFSLVLKRVLIVAFFAANSSNAYNAETCELFHLKTCNTNFVETWKDAEDESDPIDVFCQAYQVCDTTTSYH